MHQDWQTLHFSELKTDELYDIMHLRQAVFVVEQNSVYIDADGVDPQAIHMLCREAGTLIAYQRLIPPGIKYPESSMGRIVVHAGWRGKDLGRELVQRGIDHNLESWPGDICISAQAHLQTFYHSLGFVSEGDLYQEDAIPHCKMRLTVE